MNRGLGRVLIAGHAKYEAQGLLSVLLGSGEKALCGTSCPGGHNTVIPSSGSASDIVCSMLSCEDCMAVGGVETSQSCALYIEDTLLHMSYWYSVKHLWNQDKSPLCQLGTEPECTGIYPGRASAAVLVAFSFVWRVT